MYLKGSKLRLDRQRRMRRSNPALIIFILGIIAAVMYFEQYVIPDLSEISLETTPTPTPNPEALENQADQFLAEGSLFPAIDTYRLAILSNPSDPNLHVKLGHAQALAGEYESAETSARNALLLNPENPKALAELGWVLSFMGDEVGAEQALTQALALDPDNLEAHAYYAEILMDQYDVEGASLHSKEAVALDDNSLIAHRARGYVYLKTGNYDEAVVEFQAALTINDRVADLHRLLGITYWSQELYEEAIDEFTITSNYDPDDPRPDTYISSINLTQGKNGAASQFAQAAVEKEPSNPIYWGKWGITLYQNTKAQLSLDYQEAIDALSMAIHGGTAANGVVVPGMPLDYDVAEYYYTYGLALAKVRRCSEALPIFQMLIAGVPGDAIAVGNAEAGIEICEEYSKNPPTATPQPETTATPLILPTPVPTEEMDGMDGS